MVIISMVELKTGSFLVWALSLLLPPLSVFNSSHKFTPLFQIIPVLQINDAQDMQNQYDISAFRIVLL